MRKCIGTPGGPTVSTGCQHGASDRPTVSEALECHAPQGWLRADGCRRDLLRQADEVHHRGQQLGDRPTAMKGLWCATCRVGSINCDGNDCHPFKDSPRCWQITWTES